jgi:hypothetical protein
LNSAVVVGESRIEAVYKDALVLESKAAGFQLSLFRRGSDPFVVRIVVMPSGKKVSDIDPKQTTSEAS